MKHSYLAVAVAATLCFCGSGLSTVSAYAEAIPVATATTSQNYEVSALEVGQTLSSGTILQDTEGVVENKYTIRYLSGTSLLTAKIDDDNPTYTLPWEADVIGTNGTTQVTLLPKTDETPYIDARTLQTGDTIDQTVNLIPYGWRINGIDASYISPSLYASLFGDGELTVSAADAEKKAITLKLNNYTVYNGNAKETGCVVFMSDSNSLETRYIVSSKENYALNFADQTVVAPADTQTTGESYFIPEEDGVYYVTQEHLREEIVEFSYTSGDTEGDGHFHYFYPVFNNYMIYAENGEITVDCKGSVSLYSEEQVQEASDSMAEAAAAQGVSACTDVMAEDTDYWADNAPSTAYYQAAYQALPTDCTVSDYQDMEAGPSVWKTFVTTVYSSTETNSYFCAVLPALGDVDLDEARVLASDESAVTALAEETMLGTWGMCDVVEAAELARLKAEKDGDLTIRVCGYAEYHMTIENGVFRYQKEEAEPGSGDINQDGAVTVADAVLLRRYLLGDESLWTLYYLTTGECYGPIGADCDWDNADLYPDGKLNGLDLALLRQQLIAED